MPTETGQALLILVIFVLPGFVTLLIKERTHEVARSVTPFERLFSALFYSLLVYVPLVLFGAVLGLDRQDIREIYTANNGLWALTGVAVASGLVLPMLIAYGGFRWMGSDARVWLLSRLRLSLQHGTPSAWDYFFQEKIPALVRVTLRSGEVVAGYYGPVSFAAYGVHGRDLYVEEQWAVDPETFQIVEPAERSMGIWLPGEEIVEVELYAIHDAQLELFEQVGLSGQLREALESEDEEPEIEDQNGEQEDQ